MRSLVSAVVFNWGPHNHKMVWSSGVSNEAIYQSGVVTAGLGSLLCVGARQQNWFVYSDLIAFVLLVPLAKTARIIGPSSQYPCTMISAQKRNSDKVLRITKHLLTLQVLLCTSTVSVMSVLKVAHCTEIAAAKASKDVKTRLCKISFCSMVI